MLRADYYLRSRAKEFDDKVGERLFNTTMQFSSVMQRKIHLAKTRLVANADTATGTNPWTNPERHMLQLGNVYDESLIESLQSEFESALEDERNVLEVTHDGETYAKQLRSFQINDGDTCVDLAETLPSIEGLLNDEVREVLNQYHGVPLKPDFVNVYRNYHIPDEVVQNTEIYSNYWHCDSYAVDGLKLFVNLNAVTEDHGPFHIISRAETKQFVGAGYNRAEKGVPNSTIEDRANIIKATGEAGTAMLANTNLCLHRADNPAEGNHRDLAMINFLPAEKPLSENWLTDYPLDRELGKANN